MLLEARPVTEGLSIRLFEPGDLPALRWLHDRTPPAGQVATRPQPWPAALNDIPANFEAFWVATETAWDGEAIVGMAGLARAGSPAGMAPLADFLEVTPLTARLDYVRVAPERQRRGIGRRLTATALEWAAGHGFQEVILDTTAQQEAAVALYRSLGFEEAGRSMLGRWELVWFRLDLSKSPS